MRIIAGSAKGRRLFSPQDQQIRPTLDRVREAIFSIVYSALGGQLSGVVADLCAGTGALGIEALSRGASFAHFFEQRFEGVELIRQNLAHTQFTDRAEIHGGLLPGTLKELTTPCQLILVDPPYDAPDLTLTLLNEVAQRDLLQPGGLLVVQTGKKMELALQYGRLKRTLERRYGETGVHIFTH